MPAKPYRNRYDQQLPFSEEVYSEIKPELQNFDGEEGELESLEKKDRELISPKAKNERDRLRLMMERGPEKPSWKQQLAVVGMHFLNGLNRRPMDPRTMKGLTDFALGKTQWNDQVDRTRINAQQEEDNEKLTLQQKEAEDIRKHREETLRQGKEANELNNSIRLQREKIESEDRKNARLLNEENSMRSKEWEKKLDDSPVPEGWKTWKSGDTGQVYVLAPEHVRKQWQPLPANVVEYFKKQNTPVPEGPVSPQYWQHYTGLFKSMVDDTREDKKLTEAERRSRESEQIRLGLIEGQQNRQANRAKDAAVKAYENEISTVQKNFDFAKNSLVNKFLQRHGWDGKPGTQHIKGAENMSPFDKMWQDPEFVAEHGRIQDELVRNKNEAEKKIGSGRAHPYLDPRSGRPVGENQSQAQGQGEKLPTQVPEAAAPAELKSLPPAPKGQAHQKIINGVTYYKDDQGNYWKD